MQLFRRTVRSTACGAALLGAALAGNIVGTDHFGPSEIDGLEFQLTGSSAGGGGSAGSPALVPFTITGLVRNKSGQGDPTLAPGDAGMFLRLTMSNANKYAITVTSLAANPSAPPFFTANAQPSGCPQSAVVISNPGQALSIGVSAKGTATYDIPIQLAGGDIPNSCQGNTFPLALTGDAVKS